MQAPHCSTAENWYLTKLFRKQLIPRLLMGFRQEILSSLLNCSPASESYHLSLETSDNLIWQSLRFNNSVKLEMTETEEAAAPKRRFPGQIRWISDGGDNVKNNSQLQITAH